MTIALNLRTVRNPGNSHRDSDQKVPLKVAVKAGRVVVLIFLG
jgi:hypothetical protein